MDFNERLFDELIYLRESLKRKERQASGQSPLICSDDALYNLMDMHPREIDDLESKPGIEKDFIHKYGNPIPTFKTAWQKLSASLW